MLKLNSVLDGKIFLGCEDDTFETIPKIENLDKKPTCKTTNSKGHIMTTCWCEKVTLFTYLSSKTYSKTNFRGQFIFKCVFRV